jgi:hypothetical protein
MVFFFSVMIISRQTYLKLFILDNYIKNANCLQLITLHFHLQMCNDMCKVLEQIDFGQKNITKSANSASWKGFLCHFPLHSSGCSTLHINIWYFDKCWQSIFVELLVVSNIHVTKIPHPHLVEEFVMDI